MLNMALYTTTMNSNIAEYNFMKENNFTDDMYDFIVSSDYLEDEHNPVPCIEAFSSIGQKYRVIHGYFALVVCVFGTVANSLNLLILTQKEMRTPINLILTALAFVDMLLMMEYIPFSLYMYIIHSGDYSQEMFSYPWALYVLIHSHLSQTLHTISIQLTLTMAIWRYIAIRFTNQYQVNAYCTFKRCYNVIAFSFVLPILLCIPNYLTYTIVYRHTFTFRPSHLHGSVFRHKMANSYKTLANFCRMLAHGRDNEESCINAIWEKEDYLVDMSELAKAHGGALHVVHFWTFSVLVKFLPCVVLTCIMAYLVNTLYAAKERQKALQRNSGVNSTHSPNSQRRSSFEQAIPLLPQSQSLLLNPPTRVVLDNNSSRSCLKIPEIEFGNRTSNSSDWSRSPSFRNKKEIWRKESSPLQENARKCVRRSDRTSRMLVAVLLLFLVTEFPQGIMAFLTGLYGADFFRHCYNGFAEIWDILALINSAVNFILYCFMSRQFRVQFRKFFPLKQCFSKQKPSSPNIINNKNTINTTVV